MTTPLQQQIGGTHYKQMRIQPIEFAHFNDLPPCIFSALKYVVRYGRKGGLEDLQKALHFCELQVLLGRKSVRQHRLAITPSLFCLENNLNTFQTFVICKLCNYLFTEDDRLAECIEMIQQQIKQLSESGFQPGGTTFP